MVTEQIERLNALGFKAAASKIEKLAAQKRKLMIAYEHYRFVRQEKIDEFNAELQHKTQVGSRMTGNYQTLAFTPIANYQECPPAEVLASLTEALERKCFDSFEVAHIVKVEDPILFGRINDCSDRFYVDAWDNDVKIEDLLKENEG